MKYPRFFVLLSFISLLTSLLTPAVAESEKGIYVFPQAAIADYSNVSELERDPLIGLCVGYRFTGPFAVELDYLTGDSAPENPVQVLVPVDVDIWNIRSLVYFLESEQVHPFAELGLAYRTLTCLMSGRNPSLCGLCFALEYSR